MLFNMVQYSWKYLTMESKQVNRSQGWACVKNYVEGGGTKDNVEKKWG